MIRAVLLCTLAALWPPFAFAQASAAQLDQTLNISVHEFSDLSDWAKDDHAAALTVFKSTCGDMKPKDWRTLCSLAQANEGLNARAFFELFFRPVLIEDDRAPLFTGYFEPELLGSRYPTAQFRYPVYKTPPASDPIRRLDRRAIMSTDAFANKGLEIAWVADPVDLHFLQVQGSGRIRLPDGDGLRLGYGGANGHPYRSLGAELVRMGIYQPSQVSASVIRNWVKRNPEPGSELLYHNRSYVFFRELPHLKTHSGPLGAMNRSITPLRSIAIDPDYVPLGAPVWIEKAGSGPMKRLMIAQDTGSAIKGPQRADVFFGTGDVAGRAAGQLRDPGRLLVLLPIQRAYALLPAGQS